MAVKPYYPEEQEGLNVKELLFLFWQKKWFILSILIVVLTGASIYAFRLPDSYEASAQVLIEQYPQPIVQAQTKEIAVRDVQRKYYKTYEYLFTTYPILKAAVDELGLQAKFSASVDDVVDLDSAIGRLKGMVEVKAEDLIYTLKVTGQDPFLVASIANTLPETRQLIFVSNR